MNRLVLGIILASAAAFALPVRAGISGATADGTWDCKDAGGAAIGTVVVADTSYAFIDPQGMVGTYGKLHQVGKEETHLPYFVVIGGQLKDEIGASGIGLTGPKGNEHDLTGELFLVLIIPGTDMPYCRRRTVPAG